MHSTKQVSTFIIVLTVAVVVAFVGQYILNKLFNTMLLSKLSVFIKKHEGGLSRDPKDKAAKNPAPWAHEGKTGWHTNKGVTYLAFKSNASRLGYEPSAENFFNMPDDIWFKILNEVYAKGYPLQKINHLPRIQAVIVTWAWGSGVGGSESYLANFQREVMGIKDSNITRSEIVDNFKKQITPLNEKEWFLKLCDRRQQDFEKMSTCNVHCPGWKSRLNDFIKTFA